MRGKVRVTRALFITRHLPIDNGNGREISEISVGPKVDEAD